MAYDNILQMYKILDDIKKSDNNVVYIFLINASGNIVAQTSDFKIHRNLITANKIELKKYNIKVIETKNFEYKVIRDIAYPILSGRNWHYQTWFV